MKREKTLFGQNAVEVKSRKFTNFAFYDYETDGISKAHSQVTQFAAIKTDANLNIISRTEKDILVKPRIDSIPDIGAYKVTKIDIEKQQLEGITEFQLAEVVSEFFTQSGNTAICGYNTISFDDEMTRNLLYRNQVDIYGHEWRSGNGRADFYNLAKLIYAYKGDSIVFPVINDKHSLKLENLSHANGIVHRKAHDALSDVEATIDMARIMKEVSEPLFQHFLNLSDKRNVASLLESSSALLITDNLYGQENSLTTAILPIYQDDTVATKYVAIDIRQDLEPLLRLSKEEVKRLMFTKREELEEGAYRIPVVTVASNKQPLLVRIQENSSRTYFKKFNLDRVSLEKNVKLVNENLDELVEKIRFAFGEYESSKTDAYTKLYDGFISKNDSSLRAKCRYNTRDGSTKQIVEMDVYKTAMMADDPEKMATLLLRAKWNNHYTQILMSDKFSKVEFGEWVKDLQHRISKKLDGDDNTTITDFNKALAEEKVNPDLTEKDREVIGKLETYIENMTKEVIRLNQLSREFSSEKVKEMNDGCSYARFKNTHLTKKKNNTSSYDSSITAF